MKPHRPMLGFLLALNTAVFWGLLPIIVKQVMPVMNPVTIVWYRFAFSALGLILILGRNGQFPALATFPRGKLLLFPLAALGLAANFVLYNSSLNYVTPTTVQVLGQLGPMLLLVISVPVLKEHMHRSQIFGFFVLIAGIALFFNSNLRDIFTHFNSYSFGILIATIASVIWTCYGLSQKILSRHHLSSQQILLIVYTLCALLLLPFASPTLIANLNGWQMLCLLFCAANTLIAYGSFAESLTCWQSAKTGAVIALTPLFTLLFSDLLNLCWPRYFDAAILNCLGYLGALVVVSGTILSVIGHIWKPFRKPHQAHLGKSPPL